MKDAYASAGVSAITQYLDFAATILILWSLGPVSGAPKGLSRVGFNFLQAPKNAFSCDADIEIDVCFHLH